MIMLTVGIMLSATIRGNAQLGYSSSNSETNLLKSVPHLQWTQQNFIDNGWMKEFQTDTNMFTRYTDLWSISGKLRYCFTESTNLWNVCFTCYSSKTNRDIVYRIIKTITGVDGYYTKVDGWLHEHEYRWFIKGNRGYKITLYIEDKELVLDIEIKP